MQRRETGDEKTETRGTFTVRGDSRDSTDDNRASVITVIVMPGAIYILGIGQGDDDEMDTAAEETWDGFSVDFIHC